MSGFGQYVRQRRQQLCRSDPRYSLRQVASRVELQPSYLSRIENEREAPPSEAKIRDLARDLGEDPDVMLAMAGKVSDDLRQIIMKRPALFADLLRQLRTLPDHAVLRLVREVRDGRW
jgi:HTH-type transcriptional regulator, competence development regulator